MLPHDSAGPGPPVTRRLKRLLDLTLATCGLVATSPVLVVIAVLIRLQMGSPVLYRQVRPGLHGELFTLVKFRTMRHAAPGASDLQDSRERVTRLGSLLRRTSLDELPELWNVLRGDMSIVGPRPLLTEFLAYYTPEQARRHDVLPGITGWAQVNGYRGETDTLFKIQRRIELDLEYIDNWSLWLDIKIILKTVRAVINDANAY